MTNKSVFDRRRCPSLQSAPEEVLRTTVYVDTMVVSMAITDVASS